MTADRPDLDHLDTLARAATDGPWDGHTHSLDMGGRHGTRIAGPRSLGPGAHVVDGKMLSADAEFIAATDPTTVLALIAELRDLRRWKAEALPVLDGLQEVGHALGIGLGQQITGRGAVDAALDLRNERDRAQSDLEWTRRTLDLRTKALGRVIARTEPSTTDQEDTRP